MGLSNSFISLGRILGPIWAGFVFDIHVDYPYLSGSIIMFIGFLMSLFWVKEHTKQFKADEMHTALDSSS